MSLLLRDEILPPVPALAGARVLVTGSSGFLGCRVVRLLAAHGAIPVEFDAPFSVLHPDELGYAARDADWCLHLAAHKHAPAGEDHPAVVTDVNVRGTANVVGLFGPRTVLASTCKAADPMTCYGASKLIAERIVLNDGGRVVRLVNVLGSTGSVLDLWDRIPADEPLPVTDGLRMWMTAAEACRLLVAAIGFESGRYALDVPAPEPVTDLARRAYPGRRIRVVPARRGDRTRERLVAEYESSFPVCDGVVRIEHAADTFRESAPFAPALAA